MTGADIQMALDAIVEDLQGKDRGKMVEISLRNSDNTVTPFQLSSDAAGVVNAAQLSDIQQAIDGLKPAATNYDAARTPVETALESFKTERASHQGLIDAASTARTALSTALEADAGYQAAKTALDSARTDAAYVAARTAYTNNNVSENYGNLRDARGKYVE